MQDSLKRKPYKRERTIDAQQVLVHLKNCQSFFLKTLKIGCLHYLGHLKQYKDVINVAFIKVIN